MNFQVSDNSAISLYPSKGIPIKTVRIVLKGENHVASTNILPPDSASFYNACGIYIDAYDAERAPSVQICGDGSMSVEGYRRGMLLNGTKTGEKCSLLIQGVQLKVKTGENGGISTGGDVTVADSTVITDTFRAGRMTVQNSVITAAPVSVESSYANPVLSAVSFDISDSTVSITGADGCRYEGMASSNSSVVRISDSIIDIRNVDYGISATAGTIELSGVTGRLSCLETPISGNSLAGESGAFLVNRVNAVDSVIFAQAGQDILVYGDCTLPKDITELTMGGDLKIQEGKSFTVGEGQKIIFTKNYATVGDLDSAVLVNHGTLEFVNRPLVRTKLENYGTLLASGIMGKNERFVNNGIFDGIIDEESGEVHYVYGNVVAGSRTLGKIGVWNYQTILMPGAVFTIPDGGVVDAATYLTWDNLSEYLGMGEGSRIIVEEGGKLLLPAVDKDSQVVELNLSGNGTVQMGDRILYKVFYMDGDTVLSDAFIGVDGIVAQPVEPKKDGYIFKGWYTEPEGGEKFDFLTPVESGLSLYAHWDVVVKDVMLQPGGSVLTGDGNVITYGQSLSELKLNNAVFVEQGTDKDMEG